MKREKAILFVAHGPNNNTYNRFIYVTGAKLELQNSKNTIYEN